MLTDVRNTARSARVAPAIAATSLTFPAKAAVKTAARLSTPFLFMPYAISVRALSAQDVLPCAYLASGSAFHVVAIKPLIASARC